MEHNSSDNGNMHAAITRMAKNMRILGLSYVIVGGLYSLTIVGAILGVPVLISGLRLRESADSFDGWLDQDEGALMRALERQGRFFSIHAILLLVSLAVSVLAIVGMSIVMVALFADAM